MGQKLYEGDVEVNVDDLVSAAGQGATGIEWDGAIGASYKKAKGKDFGQRAEAAKRLLKATGVTKDAEAPAETSVDTEEDE